MEDTCLSFDGPHGAASVIWSDTGQHIQLIHHLTSRKGPIRKLACTLPHVADTEDAGALFGMFNMFVNLLAYQ